MRTIDQVNTNVCRGGEKQNDGVSLLRVFAIALPALLLASAAYAGADTTFDAADAKLTGWASGSAGALFASISLIRNLAKVSWNFESAALMQPVGVGLGASVGTGIISALVTALI
ncbi:hypothetical protein [Asticcacaulis sp.]|uniref:hypothetical protein n=1 Tax=Asticcacaulis sp. TaxID=1872648 RepID=UPI0026289156|nr:hypothetical protein [Asticcacaulis sp.]